MTDIVEWLRIHAVGSPYVPEMREAADEIERLREATPDRFYEVNAWCDRLQAENERLRAEIEGLKPLR